MKPYCMNTKSKGCRDVKKEELIRGDFEATFNQIVKDERRNERKETNIIARSGSLSEGED